MTRLRRSLAVSAGIGALPCAYVAPVVFYSCLTEHEHWGQFWTTAATPYGAATAGFGAIIAGSLAYMNGRDQRDSEKAIADRDHRAEVNRDLHARFTTATEQLAHPNSPTTQQAGVYAIAALADDWIANDTPQQAQVCIDVLCTYLRTHHLALTPPGARFDYSKPPHDQAVRNTVVSVIADHLRRTASSSWSTYEFDFTSAFFFDSIFEGVTFAGKRVTFSGATFAGHQASFYESTLASHRVDFTDTTFDADYALFNAATFSGGLITFNDAIFIGTNTFFDRVSIQADWMMFNKTTFAADTTSFQGAVFDGIRTTFSEATFSGDLVSFEDCTFSPLRQVSFDRVSVSDETKLLFNNPRAWGDVAFDWDDRPDNKPGNIYPSPWPPATAPADGEQEN